MVPDAAFRLKMSSAYNPQLHKREAEINPAEAALLFIDCQHYNCSREGGLYSKQGADVGLEPVAVYVTVLTALMQSFHLRIGCRIPDMPTGGSSWERLHHVGTRCSRLAETAR